MTFLSWHGFALAAKSHSYFANDSRPGNAIISRPSPDRRKCGFGLKRVIPKTKLKRGRPSTKEEKAAVRKNERIQAKITALFEHRYVKLKQDLAI